MKATSLDGPKVSLGRNCFRRLRRKRFIGFRPASRIKSLLTGGIGYHPKADGVKRRKTVRGNTIADDIVQINTVVTKAGSKSIADIIGAGEEEEE